MSRLLIVADSTCDLPAEWISQYDIRIVPTYVQFGLESLADDGVQLTRTAFYERLASSKDALPTTSAPPLGETISIMQRALADADHVIALTAPANLSAIYNIFRLAAEKTDPKRVTLIDSRMLSMGMGWQVMIAAEMAAEGNTPEQIAAAVVALQPRSDVWAALDTMTYLRRSGRVSWAAAMVGTLLQIKPIIRLYLGEVTSASRVRTSQRAFAELVALAQNAVPLRRLAILHTNNLPGAHALKDKLATIPTEFDVPIVDVTPVIGVHVGPNGLGVAIVRDA